MQSSPGAVTRIDGREYLYFVGTSYLGLQSHPEVIKAGCQAYQQYGSGSANSRTVFGTTQPVLDVERLAAQWFDASDSFYFASGWLGNAILAHRFTAVAEHEGHCVLFLDEYSHYSLGEAARLCGSSCVSFRHCDPDDLRAKLKQHASANQETVVLCDGVFAATGRIAPLAEYMSVLRDYPGSSLWIDDAHGLAVLGEQGRGSFEYAGLWTRGINMGKPQVESPRLLMTGTLSKAVGGFGGILPGDDDFIDRLKHSPYFAGASAPPAPVAAGTAKALELMLAHPEMRQTLLQNANILKTGLRQMGLAVENTPTPIVCLTIGKAENMRRIQRELMQRGIAIAYMAAYSGLSSEGGLRIAVFATHTEEMIGQLLDALRTLV